MRGRKGGREKIKSATKGEKKMATGRGWVASECGITVAHDVR